MAAHWWVIPAIFAFAVLQSWVGTQLYEANKDLQSKRAALWSMTGTTLTYIELYAAVTVSWLFAIPVILGDGLGEYLGVEQMKVNARVRAKKRREARRLNRAKKRLARMATTLSAPADAPFTPTPGPAPVLGSEGPAETTNAHGDTAP